MATADKLNFISQEVQLYVGMCIVIIGFTGNLFNIIIFITLQTFRETPSGFYLIVISTINMGHIIIALFIRILSEGFKTNIRGIPWVCKFQLATATWFHLVSLTTLCLATIDQCISMSRYRQYSNRRVAKRAVILTCMVYLAVWIANAIYWNAPLGTCMIINSDFAKYSSYFQYPVLMGVIPLSTTTIFASLAFYKIRQLKTRQVHIIRLSHDRQLTAMTLCHAIFVVTMTIFFIVTFTYTTVQTIADAELKARVNLVHSIATLINYGGFAVSFVMFLCFLDEIIIILGHILYLLLCLTTFSQTVRFRIEKDMLQCRFNQ